MTPIGPNSAHARASETYDYSEYPNRAECKVERESIKAREIFDATPHEYYDASGTFPSSSSKSAYSLESLSMMLALFAATPIVYTGRNAA